MKTGPCSVFIAPSPIVYSLGNNIILPPCIPIAVYGYCSFFCHFSIAALCRHMGFIIHRLPCSLTHL